MAFANDDEAPAPEPGEAPYDDEYLSLSHPATAYLWFQTVCEAAPSCPAQKHTPTKTKTRAIDAAYYGRWK